MANRDETVVREWQRRLARQRTISRLSIVAVVGLVAAGPLSRIAHGGARKGLGLAIMVLAAYIVVALVLSMRGFRCPKCNAYQGRRPGERDRPLSGPGALRACRACHTPFV
jgi:predicted Na+-dependent transporter